MERFERAFTLPDTVNPEGVKADYKNGVLTVTLAEEGNGQAAADQGKRRGQLSCGRGQFMAADL